MKGAKLIEKYAETHLSNQELDEIRTKIVDKQSK